MVAALCSAIVCGSAGEKDHTKVLAGADMYLDFIKPFSLQVSSKGEVTFTPDIQGE